MCGNDVFIVHHRKSGKKAAKVIVQYLAENGMPIVRMSGNEVDSGDNISMLKKTSNTIIIAPLGVFKFRGGKNKFRDEIIAALDHMDNNPDDCRDILVLSPQTELPTADKLAENYRKVLDIPQISLKNEIPSEEELLMILKAVSTNMNNESDQKVETGHEYDTDQEKEEKTENGNDKNDKYESYAKCVSWSPDGDYIATSSPDGRINIFKTKSGIRVTSFPG